MTTLTSPPSSASAPAELNGVWDAVSDARWAAAFEAGHRRAANDLMADVALIAAEVAREFPADHADVRRALRRFRERFEQHLDGSGDRRPATDGYVDGGLGI